MRNEPSHTSTEFNYFCEILTEMNQFLRWHTKKTGKMETQQINSASVGQPKCETNIKSKYLFHRLTRQVARWSVSFFPIPFRRLKYHSVSFRTLPPSSRGRCAGTLATNASVKTALWQPPEQTFENRFETFIRLMFQCEFEYSKILDFHFKYLILKVMKKKCSSSSNL